RGGVSAECGAVSTECCAERACGAISVGLRVLSWTGSAARAEPMSITISTTDIRVTNESARMLVRRWSCGQPFPRTSSEREPGIRIFSSSLQGLLESEHAARQPSEQDRRTGEEQERGNDRGRGVAEADQPMQPVHDPSG